MGHLPRMKPSKTLLKPCERTDQVSKDVQLSCLGQGQTHGHAWAFLCGTSNRGPESRHSKDGCCYTCLVKSESSNSVHPSLGAMYGHVTSPKNPGSQTHRVCFGSELLLSRCLLPSPPNCQWVKNCPPVSGSSLGPCRLRVSSRYLPSPFNRPSSTFERESDSGGFEGTKDHSHQP